MGEESSSEKTTAEAEQIECFRQNIQDKMDALLTNPQRPDNKLARRELKISVSPIEKWLRTPRVLQRRLPSEILKSIRDALYLDYMLQLGSFLEPATLQLTYRQAGERTVYKEKKSHLPFRKTSEPTTVPYPEAQQLELVVQFHRTGNPRQVVYNYTLDLIPRTLQIKEAIGVPVQKGKEVVTNFITVGNRTQKASLQDLEVFDKLLNQITPPQGRKA